MIPRERVLTALAREVPDKVPKEAFFTPGMQEVFKRKVGENIDPREYFGMEMKRIGFKGSGRLVDFSGYFADQLDGKITVREGDGFLRYFLNKSEVITNVRVDEWGVGHIPGELHDYVRYAHPLRNMESATELEKYPFPDATPAHRYEHLRSVVEKIKSDGYFVVGYVGHIFETACHMRGMDAILMDFVQNRAFAQVLLAKITDFQSFVAAKCTAAGVDMIILGDDVGMQDRMMISLECWRELLKPRLAGVIAVAKAQNPRVHIFYHSDGKIDEIIPDLIEVGVDVLNPVQPECMAPAAIKRKYGDRLSFWGTVGTQSTMPFGTPEDVRKIVKERIETVGKGGGLVIAPTHVLEPDVPWENVEAFFSAVEEYGRCK